MTSIISETSSTTSIPATATTSETSHISTMRDKHSLIKSQLEKAQSELTEKQEILRSVEAVKCNLDGRMCIAEQNIRSINEKLFTIQTGVTAKEKLHEELLKEFVEVEWKNKLAEQKMLIYENKYIDLQVEKVIRIDEVESEEASENRHEVDQNIIINKEVEVEEKQLLKQIQQEVDKYQDYKDRLSNGDFELTRILSGERLEELEMRKDGIRDAFAKREARAEGIYMDIDEKNVLVGQLKQTLLIKEKQTQARLRKVNREIQDKEATENHLKRTVEYLDRQIGLTSIKPFTTSKS